MSRILEALYDGRILPYEHTYIKSAEQMEIDQKIEAEYRYFDTKLSPEDSKRLRKMENLFTSAFSFEQSDTFGYGFRLGAALMTEVFTGGTLTND